jgi:penicillin-binding protein 1B
MRDLSVMEPSHENIGNSLEVAKAPRQTASKAKRWLPILIVFLVIVAFAIPYRRLCTRVDQKLDAGLFLNSLTYFSAPETLALGDRMTPEELVAALERAGAHSSFYGNIVQSSIPVEVRFANGGVVGITDTRDHRSVTQYELPRQLITNISAEDRGKRTLIQFSNLPPVLIQAILSAEDKRFFKHSGFDLPRVTKALYVDLKDHRKQQGASTISMQLARNVWLSRNKSWRRKIEEALVTLHLERKLTKEQIFQDYCNSVYLGDRGSFRINGVGEAARTYFGKDVKQLNLTEAATLAGLIQRPSYLNPFRFPDRALDRRNVVLSLMRTNRYISRAEYDVAMRSPLGLHAGANGSGQTQYFLDLAGNNARKLNQLPSTGAVTVDTTMDLRLQRAAERAISDGLDFVNKQLAAGKHLAPGGVRPQAVLIALDPHTGEVKALAGGVDYATSQFNRALAKRPPGSAFKPFVYAAALNTAILGGPHILTEASTVDDSPSTFQYGRGLVYTPNNFKADYQGTVTLRLALAHSLNVATVKVGDMVGFENVVALARAAGLNEDIRPTPAVALGAYQTTPMEIAEAYTIFANGGVRVRPTFIATVHDASSEARYERQPETRRVLDPRVAFLMVDMLQEVMRSGTAAGVRTRGFQLPAAGKTGTSHDGWFAGFTSHLLCIVWVGYDDYRELGLEGARSALPIWTEFMQEAIRYAQYGNVKPFGPPPGVVRADVDLETGQLAGPDCPGRIVSAYFIPGTQPTGICGPLAVEVIPTADGGVVERRVSNLEQSR